MSTLLAAQNRTRGLATAAPLHLLQTVKPVMPGIGLALAIAVAASLVGSFLPLVGAAVIAIVLGVVARQLIGLADRFAAGVRFSSRTILQMAIVLLGTGLSLKQVWTTGSSSLIVLLGTLIVGIPVMLAIGRLLGIDRTLVRLISVGTGICGASAIGALAPILAADDEVIAYAISTVFVFNISAVLLFPPIGHLLGLSQYGFGLWAGTAVNDTSSVVAAGYAFGAAAGAYAVTVKLTRTVLIVPVSLIFAAVAARERRSASRDAKYPVARVALPVFLLWFLLASLLNTLGIFGKLGGNPFPSLGTFLIVVALAGVGLSADMKAIARTGFRPIVLGATGWMILATMSLLLQYLTGLR
ncbi:MAG: hypothetical protein JWO42_264 [Chloroflexi bacterium]|jgi:uncharacterized integral membrane protein (TIGR00698 family)|nr:hypothetical protein [Chloroflexota bacterium]